MNVRQARVLVECGVMTLLVAYILFRKQPDEILADRRKAEEARQQARREQEELAWGRTHVEAEIVKKEADDENLAGQIGDMVVTNLDICGQWNGPAHDNGVYLTIKRGTNGELHVMYFADGDVDCWRLRRTGRFEAGVLTLDRPVMGYPGDAYRHFYAIGTPNGPRLTTQTFVRDWILARDGRKWNQERWRIMDEFGAVLKQEGTEPGVRR
jgi:hypothetical protein